MKLSLLLLLGFACVFLYSTAWARLPNPYQQTGVIASIDCNACTLALVRPPKPRFTFWRTPKPTSFTWTADTRFIKNGKPAPASELRPGEQVRLYYYYSSRKKPPYLLKVVSKVTAE
jgi:hypothetical protein